MWGLGQGSGQRAKVKVVGTRLQAPPDKDLVAQCSDKYNPQQKALWNLNP